MGKLPITVYTFVNLGMCLAVHEQDGAGKTALHYSATRNAGSALKMLIAKGADLQVGLMIY